jgi:hypothetical protein
MCLGEVLTAVLRGARAFKNRCDLEFFEECVWVEIPTRDGFKLLLGNHYFSHEKNYLIKPQSYATYLIYILLYCYFQHVSGIMSLKIAI